MAKGGSPMGGGGFGGQQGGFSGGFQPSRQGFNQMPQQQQQSFGGFDYGYGMPQQQQNFGGFGGGYNMPQQYNEGGGSYGGNYGGGYGMPQQLQQFQQQARQYQQPMQQRFQQPMQQRFQQQRFQQQMPQTDMPMVRPAVMPHEYTNQPLGSMEDRVSRLSARGLGDSRSQAEQPMVAHTGMPQDYETPQMPPAPNMSQTSPENQRMQFMRMMQQMNFSGGRPYGRSEYTQRY